MVAFRTPLQGLEAVSANRARVTIKAEDQLGPLLPPGLVLLAHIENTVMLTG
jgi:hypothetical protein